MKLYGEDVFEAAIHLPLGSVHASSPPLRPADSRRYVQPADAIAAAQTLRDERQRRGIYIFRRSGSGDAMAASSTFIRCCRKAHIPKTVQQALLDMVHELHSGAARFQLFNAEMRPGNQA